MRFILSLFALLVLTAPSYAADTATPKSTLVKGSKSYQVRYTKPAQSVGSIEPAAGVEMPVKTTQTPSQNMPTSEKPVKEMKLHGKK